MAKGKSKSKEMILGTLVDRAVSMPYAKPMDVSNWRKQNCASEVKLAAKLLKTALKEVGAEENWSTADLVIDPGGPWWSDTLRDFFNLSKSDMDWVLQRLIRVSSRASMAIDKAWEEDLDLGSRWKWIWSQSPLIVRPGKYGSIPRISKPDFIVGVGGKRCELIDLKVTSRKLNEIDLDYFSGVLRFQEWQKVMESVGFRVDSKWILAVSSKICKLDMADRWRWLQVSDK